MNSSGYGRAAGMPGQPGASILSSLCQPNRSGARCRSTVYDVKPRTDRHGVDLISDALPFGRLWYTQVSHAIGYPEFYSRSHDAVIRVYDSVGNVIETRDHAGDFKEW